MRVRAGSRRGAASRDRSRSLSPDSRGTGGRWCEQRRRWRLRLAADPGHAWRSSLRWSILWQASLVPKQLSVQEMGYADYGGGRPGRGRAHGHGGPGSVSVETLVADPARKADVRRSTWSPPSATLTVGGRAVPGFTLNGTSPGPTITATAGRAGRGAAAERVGDRRRRPALARHRRAERDGRRGRGDPGRRAGRRRVRLPVRGRAGRDVLVPLAPGVARAGDRRAVRSAGRAADAGRCRPDVERAGRRPTPTAG